ncbi:MAG: glycosyltransferase family 2 protein [Planctomycetes bacterium]|nr:glycosyltransferase family 2 protein [Planctomycetota bacterium]
MSSGKPIVERRAPRLAALFVNYNTGEYARRAVTSLWAQRVYGHPLETEVVVVDNCSPLRERDRPFLEWLRDEHGVKVIWNDRNAGYSAGMNLALAHTSASHVLVVNPDVFFQEGCVEAMLDVLHSSDDVGCVGPFDFLDEALDLHLPIHPLPTLEDEVAKYRGRFRRSASLTYSISRAKEAHRVHHSTAPVEVGMISGACMLFRRSTIEQIGFFDERYPLYYEDSDLCRRVWAAGLRVVQVPSARMTHFVSRAVSTATSQDSPMKRWYTARLRYFRKWYGPLGEELVRRIEEEIPKRWRFAGKPATPCEDLGTLIDAPTIHFSREVPLALVEVALDSGFYLTATTYARGSSWTFPPAAWRIFFTGVKVFVRILDVRDFSVVGTWMFATRPDGGGA